MDELPLQIPGFLVFGEETMDELPLQIPGFLVSAPIPGSRILHPLPDQIDLLGLSWATAEDVQDTRQVVNPLGPLIHREVGKACVFLESSTESIGSLEYGKVYLAFLEDACRRQTRGPSSND